MKNYSILAFCGALLLLAAPNAFADDFPTNNIKASFKTVSSSLRRGPSIGRSSKKQQKYWFSPSDNGEETSYDANLKDWRVHVSKEAISFSKLDSTSDDLQPSSFNLSFYGDTRVRGGKLIATAVGVMGLSRQIKKSGRHRELKIDNAFQGTNLRYNFSGKNLKETWLLRNEDARGSFNQKLSGIEFFKLKTDGSLNIVLSNGNIEKSKPSCEARSELRVRPVVCRYLPTGVRSFTVATPVELASDEQLVVSSILSFQ